jgi:hypothetical protein
MAANQWQRGKYAPYQKAKACQFVKESTFEMEIPTMRCPGDALLRIKIKATVKYL